MVSPKPRKRAHFSPEHEHSRHSSRSSPPPAQHRQPLQGILRSSPNPRNETTQETRGRTRERPQEDSPRSPSQPQPPQEARNTSFVQPYNAPTAVPTAGQQVFVHHAGGVQPFYSPYPGQTYITPSPYSSPVPQNQPFITTSAATPNMSYENSAPPNMGVHFQPPVPDTTNGPFVHRYYPRHDGGGVFLHPYPVGAPIPYRPPCGLPYQPLYHPPYYPQPPVTCQPPIPHSRCPVCNTLLVCASAACGPLHRSLLQFLGGQVALFLLR